MARSAMAVIVSGRPSEPDTIACFLPIKTRSPRSIPSDRSASSSAPLRTSTFVDTPAAINASTLALIDAGIGLSEYCVSCSAGYIDGGNTPLLDLNYYEKSGIQNYRQKSSKTISSKSRLTKPWKTSNQQIKTLQKLENEQKDKKEAMDTNEDNEEDHEQVKVEADDKKEKSYCSGQLTLAIMPVTNKIITMQMQSIINIDKMERLLQICTKGCKDIHKIMKLAIKQHSFQLMQHRGFINR